MLQVRSATERALFEARRREVEEERRVEAALLEKALELKDRAAAQRQALAAAARGQQTLTRWVGVNGCRWLVVQPVSIGTTECSVFCVCVCVRVRV